MANKDPVLSLEEFDIQQNNFALFFCGKPNEHFMGDMYRDVPVFRRCFAANIEAFNRLAAELYGFEKRDERGTPDFERKLYQAYLLMHPFAESNWEMFV